MAGSWKTKQALAADLLQNSTLTYRQVAACVGCSLGTVRGAARVLGITPRVRKISP